MNCCTSPEEARKGFRELEGVMNLVLLRSSSARGGGVSEEKMEREMEDDHAQEEGREARVRVGMNDDRELEARYWELSGKLRIVESDFNGIALTVTLSVKRACVN